MKKILKIFLLIILSITSLFILTFAIIFSVPPKIEFDAKKLIDTGDFMNFYDSNNNIISITDGKDFITDNTPFSSEIKQVFVVAEDKKFYSHHGIDYLRMLKAMFVNLKNFSFKQGASTISQQLIKNTHLTNKKTISRKITEIKLVKKLEKQYSKDEIISMYLNTIYFGENTFGIHNAAKHYFNKSVNELTLAETATLAGMISAPSKLTPNASHEACINKRNFIIRKMQKEGVISQKEAETAINEELVTKTETKAPVNAYIKACLNELEYFNISPYMLKNCKIKTFCNMSLQTEISDDKFDYDYQSIVIDNKTMGIIAYYSSCGEIEREIASLAKPILVYSPAIEEGFITEHTKIRDEETDFNGYKPKNFGDKYYGDITVKEAISKSLNIPSVKVLDGIGIAKSKKYAEKLGLNIQNNGLSVALGNIGNGIKLKDIAGAYSVFANYGEYKKPHFIDKIINYSGSIIYKFNNNSNRVFSASTCSFITDALTECVKSGTAKKLSYLPFNVAAKTGTNGTKNGNTDCYSVAYTSAHTVCCWIGNRNNEIIVNETGSNTPCYLVGKFLEYLYKNNIPDNFEYKDLQEVTIDKLSYEENGEILLADENTPDNYIIMLYFKKENLPTNKSRRFTDFNNLNIETCLDGNKVLFNLKLPSYVSVDIYKILNNQQKTLIFSGNSNFSDTLDKDGIYKYSAIFHINGKSSISSDERQLKSIKYEKRDVENNFSDVPPADWWID